MKPAPTFTAALTSNSKHRLAWWQRHGVTLLVVLWVLMQLWLPARVFLAAVVLFQGFVVMMTVKDWDVRFLTPVLPCVFALAALGAQP